MQAYDVRVTWIDRWGREQVTFYRGTTTCAAVAECSRVHGQEGTEFKGSAILPARSPEVV